MSSGALLKFAYIFLSITIVILNLLLGGSYLIMSLVCSEHPKGKLSRLHFNTKKVYNIYFMEGQKKKEAVT